VVISALGLWRGGAGQHYLTTVMEFHTNGTCAK
jgi:hypothetical protein